MKNRFEFKDEFDEFLDETYGSIEVAGAEFFASEILYELLPEHYRLAYQDWLESEGED